MEKTNTGYHLKQIKKGVLGELSKIEEELEELKDSELQGIKIMSLIELSDLYGAIEFFVQDKFNLEMDDLKKFSDLNKKVKSSPKLSTKELIEFLNNG